MNTIIRLKIKKEVDTITARKILKLKGQLISQSFTDLIHYDDADEDNYINFFTVAASRKDEVTTYILQNIADSSLGEAIDIVLLANK